MKLNARVYRQLTNEPFLTQEIEGKKIEFIHMNDTPLLFQYASRGRFALWTSDGVNYRVLIEKKYYEALEDFYQPEVNKIWLDFLEGVGALNRKINMWFIIPTLILYVVIAGLATFLFQDYTLQILLGMIVLVVLSNMIQGRIVNRKVREENLKAQDHIRRYLGDEKFEELIKAQDQHYQDYFKFNEEQTTEEVVNEDVEVIETEEISEEDEDDGTKGN
ncbi:MAG: hypothetical protein WC992_04610 [Acholeplasmataceae bacterium]|jgi:hypothetical protein|nr:hypothetical protein [Acholeplasmataceae bacterium]